MLDRMTELMGGAAVLGTKPTSTLDWIVLVRTGLPSTSAKAIAQRLGDDFIVVNVGSPKRSASSKKTKGRRAKRLTLRQSERIVRLARIVARSTEVFGTEERALGWLKEPNRALGENAPLSLLDTDIGAQAVEDVLGRIEHGVFS
jgi:putative toxin-antitoxin system antitoxin component (TIGR02293 family)